MIRQSAYTPARPEGWPVDHPSRSILFGATPYGFDAATRESLVSFFRRTSDAHGLLPRSLAYHLIIPLMDIPSQYSADLMADECYRLELCGLNTKAVRWIECLNQLTVRADLKSLTLLSLKNFVSSYQLIDHANRFCPACYAEDELTGRQKYDRLLWTIRCVTACPKHDRRLTFEPRAKRQSRMSFMTPGVSRNDGRSLANCTSEKASRVEVIVARLVCELIDDLTWIEIQKSPSIGTFLTRLADSLFDGNSAALAHHLGLSKSQLHEWAHDEILPSLAGVVRIAYAFECSVADVIFGDKAKPSMRRGCKLPRGLFHLPRNDGHKIPHHKLLASLSVFMKRNPDADAQGAARHLQVSPTFLRKNFPEQNEALVRAGRLFRQRSSQATCAAKDEAYKKSFLALADNGTYPSRRKVAKQLKHSGISLTYADEKRAKRKAYLFSNQVNSLKR